MKNRIKIEVKIYHYVNGRDIQYTSYIEPLYINKKLLNGRIFPLSAINDYCSAIHNYCKELAKNIIPYDANYEDYLVQFWYNDELISSTLLSNYSDYFGQNIEDVEIAD